MQRSGAQPWDEAHELVELDRAECLRLVGTAAVGRVIFTEAALPTAQPVSFLLDDEEVVFQTSGGSKLAVAGRHHVVAFEVDDLDPVARTGWSVVGVGEAYEVVDPRRLAELADRIPPPWASGRTGHVISIPLQRLTGRRLG
ncbi:pyridoxamine 5'-phosphate oxidase family protein [Pseudonocardia lacus]|uniref:pyridoxamine 5'-phosphate oxidase family protein n=1 Tax=Pseudonocardia lacus TaxID=2835865 RepID=UPI001BDD9FDA|nr:pyridoxamine 5'-phosphate oxidase family protein [Pseudonocardia lacus]